MSNKPTNFPNGVESAQGFYGPVNGAVSGAVAATSLSVSGNAAITGTLTLDLTGIPVYADQTAASAALGPGQVFRVTTTGALGITLA